jgi:stearoyl-CoA 9-desaturase NADPH oxidoreductase
VATIIYGEHMFTDVLDRINRFGTALSSPLPVDAFVRLVDPLWSSTLCRAKVERIIRETPEAVTIVLRPGRGWEAFEAGQWVALGVDIDGIRHRRPYSLTSVPGQAGRLISLTVQAVPGGLVSNYLVHQLSLGDIVHLDPPTGEFTVDTERHSSLLFITGGSGITPVMGILRFLQSQNADLDAVHLHHAPSNRDALFFDELCGLAASGSGFHFEFTATGHGPLAVEHQLSQRRLDGKCSDWRRRDTWVCGPAPLVEAAEVIWEAAGVLDRLHIERFRPTFAPSSDEDGGGVVSFAISGGEAVADGNTPLLDVAEAAGLSPKHGCRMGICHTCVVRLSSGSVCDLRDGRIQSDEGDFVQICVSAPRGDVALDL